MYNNIIYWIPCSRAKFTVLKESWYLVLILNENKIYCSVLTAFRHMPLNLIIIWSFQLFSILFFLMLFVLAIGSLSAFHGVLNTTIRDAFPNIPHWKVSALTTTCSCLGGLIFVTPVGFPIFLSFNIRNIRRRKNNRRYGWA